MSPFRPPLYVIPDEGIQLGITICIRDVELGPGLFNLQGSHSQIAVIIQGFSNQPCNTGIDKKLRQPVS
ncbi:hypothetical protein ACP0HM_36370 [Escherichia coli]